jgi:acetyl-CoA synthetase
MDQVCQIANVLLKYEIQKGDPIIIYMPMIPEAIISMLACAHIGAVHAVVFAGFSAESLHERIQDCGTRFVITANEGKRGGRTIPMKLIVDNALSLPNRVDKVLVYQHTSTKVQMTEDRDLWWHDELSMARPFCPTVPLSAEDPLFLLYTSGSTGTPKGILHTIGGYLLEAAMTVKYVFDCHSDDIFACMADIGWITGHSYSLYGPLALGVTTVIFESTPTYPSPSRFWQLIERHKITQFYTAPTAIRLLSRLGDDWVEKCDLSSVRVLGSVGEPINPEAWEWYYHKVGGGQCAIVDTYWQTETGSIIVYVYHISTMNKL